MQICAFGRTLFLSSIGNLILAIGNWYVLAICLTYKCNKVAASLEERLTLARNYRNEFILRYDNQRNVSTSFIGEFEVFLWLYLCFFCFRCFCLFYLSHYIKERRALTHTALKFKQLIKTMNAPQPQSHNTLPYCLFCFFSSSLNDKCLIVVVHKMTNGWMNGMNEWWFRWHFSFQLAATHESEIKWLIIKWL